MRKALVGILAFAAIAFGQAFPGGGGGSGVGVGAANPTATCAGTVTSCAVTVTTLNLTAANFDTAITKCYVTSTGAELILTGNPPSGGPPYTTFTPAFTSTTGVYCTVNSNGGAGAAGAAGAPGAGTVGVAATNSSSFTLNCSTSNYTVEPVSGSALVITVPTGCAAQTIFSILDWGSVSATVNFTTNSQRYYGGGVNSNTASLTINPGNGLSLLMDASGLYWFQNQNGPGAAGATGTTGAAGTNGTNGTNGAAGATGATGANGTGSGTLTGITAGCGLSGGAITISGTIGVSPQVTAHNGSYAILAGDCGNSLTSNTTAAWSIAQAGTTGFLQGYNVRLQNVGASGTITVTAAAGTFYGSAASGTSATISAGNGVLLISDGTNWEVYLQGGGTGGTSNCCGLPSVSTVGSMVVSSAANANNELFGAAKTGCGAGHFTFWPVAGYFVAPAAAVSATLTSSGALWPYTNCGQLSTVAPYQGTGLLLPVGSLAGGYVDTFAYDGWHAGVGSQAGISASNTLAVPVSASAAFVADSGNAVTVLGSSLQTILVASTPAYFGFGGVSSATELAVAVPLPYAGTFQSFAMCRTTTSTNTIPVAFRDNGASVGTPGTMGFTLAATAAICDGWDPTNTYAASAGDYVDVFINTPAGGAQSTIGWFALGFTAATGSPEMIWGMIDGTLSGTSTSYSMPETSITNGTVTNAQAIVPRACTAGNLYVAMAGNSGTSTITFTLNDNGSATTLTGSVTEPTAAGVYLLDNTHTPALAQGDKIALTYANSAGTTPTIGGWSFKCQ